MIQNYEQVVPCVLSRIMDKLSAGVYKITINLVAPGKDQIHFTFLLFIIFVVVKCMGE